MIFAAIFVLLISAFIILSLFIISILKKNDNEKNIDLEIKNEQDYNGYYANGGEGQYEICYIVAKKNGDWSHLPLTDNFRNKYSEKDGILGSINYDNIEYRPYAGTDEDYYFKEDIYFVITQGKSKTSYRCFPRFSNDGKGQLLDDVFLYDIKQLYDENGIRITISGVPIKNLDSFTYLANGGDDEKSVAVTEHFHKKYPYFLDLFIHYSPLGANNIEFIKERSSWERKEAYFEVDSILECIKRRYKVKFFIDENGYLDDAEVKLVGEYPYQFGYLIQAYDSVFYKNSNWDHLKLTDNFRKKYKKELGVFKDIDLIDYNISYDVERYKSNSIVRYKYKDGTHKWFYEKYTYVDNDYLDDVEILPIDYSGENAKEAKEAYIKQYE